MALSSVGNGTIIQNANALWFAIQTLAHSLCISQSPPHWYTFLVAKCLKQNVDELMAIPVSGGGDGGDMDDFRMKWTHVYSSLTRPKNQFANNTAAILELINGSRCTFQQFKKVKHTFSMMFLLDESGWLEIELADVFFLFPFHSGSRWDVSTSGHRWNWLIRWNYG